MVWQFYKSIVWKNQQLKQIISFKQAKFQGSIRFWKIYFMYFVFHDMWERDLDTYTMKRRDRKAEKILDCD